MSTIKQLTALLAVLLSSWHLSFAAPATTPEEEIMTFLWSGGTKEMSELHWSVEDGYNTRITFKRDKTFKRSDGIGGVWSFEGGKLILTALDVSGLTVKFDRPKPGTQQLKGIVTSKGKLRGRHITLKSLPK